MTLIDNHFRSRPTAILLIACAAILLSAKVPAQSLISPTAGTTPETLEIRIKEANAAVDLDEATKEKLLELYGKASSLISQRRIYATALDEFASARKSATEQARVLREELDSLEIETVPVLLPEELRVKPLPELEQQLLTEKANLAALTARLTVLEELLESQSQRSTLARNRLTEAKTRVTVIADELKLPVPEGEIPLISEARRWAWEHEVLSISTEIEMLDQELLSQPMRIELLGVQRDKATLEVKRLSGMVERLANLTVEKRGVEARTAKEAADETQRRAIGKHVLIQAIAERNALLGETLNNLAKSREQVTNEENTTSELAKRITDNFRLARQKLDIAGLSQALGQVLLLQSRNLPDSSDFRRAERSYQRRVVDSSLRQILHQQERGRLRDIAGYVENLLVEESITEQARLRGEILPLAEARRGLLDKAIAADDTYQQALGELDFARRQLSEIVTTYDEFLDERLLWIRSGELPTWNMIKSIPQSLSIFLLTAHWQELGLALKSSISKSWILIVGVILFTILLIKSNTVHAALKDSGNTIGQLRHDRFSNTIKALGWTLLLALSWPLLLASFGLGLLNIDSGSFIVNFTPAQSEKGQFAPAVGYALYRVALYSFFFEAFHAFCRPHGLAVVHFHWNPSNAEVLSREIRRLALIFLPAAFIVATSTTYDSGTLGGGLSRIGILIVMIALAWFLGRILVPTNGALRDFYITYPRSPLTWFRYLWVILGIALPLILAGLAIVGYVYTAAQFGERLISTLWLIFGIILIHQLIERWVLLTERRLAFQAALERHRLQRAEREAAEDEGSAGESDLSLLDEPEIDFGALSDDTTKLINTVLILVSAVGLWAIWADVLPAFRIFNEISLWQYSVVVEGREKLVPVTLNDVILGMLVILIVTVAARRLPALLEIVLLARLNITAGSRYAIATLTKYVIVATGVVLVFNLLGGNWSKIQWLVAALGVGIGFGLQEIVANFICGIILLFERPIRIGDMITVGDTDGVVTSIRIRSTTIRNPDQKELIVPNKEFITGRLLNWTLSDPITRLVIPVGIAYGSDVGRAIQLVQEAAEGNERVLEEPPALVTFENFGDNALTIMLRCFIGSMEFRRQITSDLNASINRKFEHAGIVVAFPQRDIHLDTSQPLDVRIHRVQDDSDEAGGKPAGPKRVRKPKLI